MNVGTLILLAMLIGRQIIAQRLIRAQREGLRLNDQLLETRQRNITGLQRRVAALEAENVALRAGATIVLIEPGTTSEQTA